MSQHHRSLLKLHFRSIGMCHIQAILKTTFLFYRHVSLSAADSRLTALLSRVGVSACPGPPPTASRAQSDYRGSLCIFISIVPRSIFLGISHNDTSALLPFYVHNSVCGSSLACDTCKHGNENTCIECNLVTSNLQIPTWHDIVSSIRNTTFTLS